MGLAPSTADLRSGRCKALGLRGSPFNQRLLQTGHYLPCPYSALQYGLLQSEPYGRPAQGSPCSWQNTLLCRIHDLLRSMYIPSIYRAIELELQSSLTAFRISQLS